jgi:Tfp pilus assembly protein PilO
MNIAGLVYLAIMALVIGFMIYSRIKQNKKNKIKEEKEQLKKEMKKKTNKSKR